MVRASGIALVLSVVAVGCGGSDEGAQEGSSNFTSVERPGREVPGALSAEENRALWGEYCIAGADLKPVANYDNDAVMAAAKELSAIAGHSFAMYSGISKHHRGAVPESVASVVNATANEFLSYLCGEFRDRATLVEEKINWINNLNYLDNTESEFNPSGDPWAQMKAKDYYPYLSLSHSVFSGKQQKIFASGGGSMSIGNRTFDTPVPGQTVCETKYMFAEYLRKGKAYTTVEEFDAGYQTFRGASCELPADEDWYYDFRGDTNFKPNSPESNGMIWFSQMMTTQCKGYGTPQGSSTVTAEQCQQYFAHPFTQRFNAARAGLAAWVLVDPTNAGDSNSNYTIVPRAQGDESYFFGDKAPFLAVGSDGQNVPLLAGWENHYMESASLGLETLFAGNKEKVEEILQIAVDRHTDWYSSRWDDRMAYKPKVRDQAYSPFVASSYEMSESNGFVTCGVTVPCPASDPSLGQYKHWMFVFKVHKDNWYTPERLANEPEIKVDFDRMWFDETSFGDTGLANSEKAWDRMGSALEGEYAAILYLRNVGDQWAEEGPDSGNDGELNECQVTPDGNGLCGCEGYPACG